MIIRESKTVVESVFQSLQWLLPQKKIHEQRKRLFLRCTTLITQSIAVFVLQREGVQIFDPIWKTSIKATKKNTVPNNFTSINAPTVGIGKLFNIVIPFVSFFSIWGIVNTVLTWKMDGAEIFLVLAYN